MLFLQISLFKLKCCGYFWAALKTIGILFVPTSVTLAGMDAESFKLFVCCLLYHPAITSENSFKICEQVSAISLTVLK